MPARRPPPGARRRGHPDPGRPAAGRSGATLRHARCTCTRSARCSTPLAAYQRALAGRPHLVCYAMKANSSLAVLQTFRPAGCGFDIVSGGELARVLAAGGDPARVVFSGVGKTRRRDAPGAAGRRALLQRREPAELGACRPWPSPRWAHRAGQPAREPRRRRRHPPLHLDRPEATTSSAWRTTRRWRPTGRPQRCRAAGGGHRLPHRLADHADRALSRRAGPPARPGRGGRGEGIPIHHVDVGGGLGITYTDERRRRPTCWWSHCCSAWTRAATATARCCWSPAARWWAMPACC
jgi:diaminopimelate decarboxylase